MLQQTNTDYLDAEDNGKGANFESKVARSRIQRRSDGSAGEIIFITNFVNMFSKLFTKFL